MKRCCTLIFLVLLVSFQAVASHAQAGNEAEPLDIGALLPLDNSENSQALPETAKGTSGPRRGSEDNASSPAAAQECPANFSDFLTMFMSLDKAGQLKHVALPYKVGSETFNDQKLTTEVSYKVYTSLDSLRKLSRKWKSFFPTHAIMKESGFIFTPLSSGATINLCFSPPETSCYTNYIFELKDGCWKLTEHISNDTGI